MKAVGDGDLVAVGAKCGYIAAGDGSGGRGEMWIHTGDGFAYRDAYRAPLLTELESMPKSPCILVVPKQVVPKHWQILALPN